jgi:hypothetical protein
LTLVCRITCEYCDGVECFGERLSGTRIPGVGPGDSLCIQQCTAVPFQSLGEVAIAMTSWLVQASGVLAMFDSDTGKSQKRAKEKIVVESHTQVSALLSSGTSVLLLGRRCAEFRED